MAQVLKNIAQAIPTAVTLTDIYTVPAVTTTVISSLSICNQSSTDATFRIAIAKAGATDTPAQYIYYDTPVFANDTFTATIGLSIATTDVLRAYSSNGLVSFNAFGAENT
jgi:hypothetical protein